jgi:DNA-binding response OmpR family regulator
MKKIAIIDDDPDIIEAITILLESREYSVVSAGNIQDGTKLVNSENPDLILLDVMMEEPDDGFYLANKLRKSGVSIPIILLTSVSKSFGYDFGAGETLPINDFIEKPVSPIELLEKINKQIESKEENHDRS